MPLFLLHKLILLYQKIFRQNSAHYFILKEQEPQQITFNHSSDIDFEDFMNLYKKWAAKPYSILGIDATLSLDNPLCFRKNLSREHKR